MISYYVCYTLGWLSHVGKSSNSSKSATFEWSYDLLIYWIGTKLFYDSSLYFLISSHLLIDIDLILGLLFLTDLCYFLRPYSLRKAKGYLVEFDVNKDFLVVEYLLKNAMIRFQIWSGTQ